MPSSQGSSAAGPPSASGVVAITIAVVTAAGSRTGPGVPHRRARLDGPSCRWSRRWSRPRSLARGADCQIGQQRVPAGTDRGGLVAPRRGRRGGGEPAPPLGVLDQRRSASEKAATSSSATSTPSSPSPRMSEGPRGQSKADHGQPLPHRLDDHHPEALEAGAEREHRRRRPSPRRAAACGPSARRGRPARAPRAAPPARRAPAPSRRSPAASPGARSRQAPRRASSRSNPFCVFSRPAATTTFASRVGRPAAEPRDRVRDQLDAGARAAQQLPVVARVALA